MISEITDIAVYLGQFGSETRLCDLSSESDIIPQKGDFIFYDTEPYKVMYCMVDVDNGEYSIFVRRAVEEDF
mgnify:FL=1